MKRSSGLIFICLFFIIAFSAREAFALKCWRCSSDSSTYQFCLDKFDPSLVHEQQRRWAYVNCPLPPNTQQPTLRPVCQKMVQLFNGRTVVWRSCSFEEIGASPNACMNISTPSFVKTLSCSTCFNEDGCNGQDTAQVKGAELDGNGVE